MAVLSWLSSLKTLLTSESVRWHSCVWTITVHHFQAAHSTPAALTPPTAHCTRPVVKQGTVACDVGHHAILSLHCHFLLPYTPFTQYNRLSNQFDNWLYRVNKHPTGCQSGCQTGLYNRFDNRLYTRYSRLSNRLSNGWMFVYTIQPVWQQVVSYKRGFRHRCCLMGTVLGECWLTQVDMCNGHKAVVCLCVFDSMYNSSSYDMYCCVVLVTKAAEASWQAMEGSIAGLSSLLRSAESWYWESKVSASKCKHQGIEMKAYHRMHSRVQLSKM